jgi:2,5-dihydroxypyridine 5,6-dioxygenase
VVGGAAGHPRGADQDHQLRRAAPGAAPLFADDDLRRRVRAAAQLEQASRLRHRRRRHRLTYELGEFGYIHQYGVADEPGRWDHFASAWSAVGNTDGINGTVAWPR